MIVKETLLNDCYVINLKRYEDSRGYFMETFDERIFSKTINQKVSFVQDNLSLSYKNVLRGIHFQYHKPQGKLVRVTKGCALDVAVDLRVNSTSFGKHISLILNDKNNNCIWIPEGFGHAFLALENNTILEYKCTNFYEPSDQRCIIWNDDDLNINWPENIKPNLSEKDLNGISFKEFNSYNFT